MNTHKAKELETSSRRRTTAQNGKATQWRAAILAALFVPGMLPAQTATDSGPVDPELVRKLMKRVEELETQVKDLKKNPGNGASSGASSAAASEAAAARDTFPQIAFHGFGDVTYRVSDLKGDHNNFALGQLDLFVTSRISDKVSILNEDVIEADENNNFGIEVERLLLQYHASDWFNVDVGRFHTSIGYYNTAYHHGTWFQTAVGRPQFLDFEDGGGLIATHGVGVSVSGAIPSGSLNLHYTAELMNGRPYHAAAAGKSPVLNISDDNDQKAFNLAFHVKPDGLPGLQAGAGVYHDIITPDGLSQADELLLHGHVVYKNADWEWLSEAFWMRHDFKGGKAYTTPAYYAQVAHQFGAFRPYLRFSYVNAPDTDGALALIGGNGRRYGPSVGIRYDFTSLAAVKLQYDYIKSTADGHVNQITGQVAFTF